MVILAAIAVGILLVGVGVGAYLVSDYIDRVLNDREGEE